MQQRIKTAPVYSFKVALAVPVLGIDLKHAVRVAAGDAFIASNGRIGMAGGDVTSHVAVVVDSAAAQDRPIQDGRSYEIIEFTSIYWPNRMGWNDCPDARMPVFEAVNRFATKVLKILGYVENEDQVFLYDPAAAGQGS